MTGWIILAIVVAIVGYAIFLYNDLVKNRQLTQEGWSGIDVQLKRRTDLIPNMLETVKGYMGHERETLEAVVKARQIRLPDRVWSLFPSASEEQRAARTGHRPAVRHDQRHGDGSRGGRGPKDAEALRTHAQDVGREDRQ